MEVKGINYKYDENLIRIILYSRERLIVKSRDGQT